MKLHVNIVVNKNNGLFLFLYFIKNRSKSTLRRFKQSVKELVRHGHMPDYRVEIDDKTNLVTFFGEQHLQQDYDDYDRPPLKTETYEYARIVAPQYDIYYLEREWVHFWVDSGKPPLHNPDNAFIAFVKEDMNATLIYNLRLESF